jgi:hypothetical protein
MQLNSPSVLWFKRAISLYLRALATARRAIKPRRNRALVAAIAT